MILGLKVGLQKESYTDIERTQTPFVEVWFNIVRKDEYNHLFSFMNKRQMQVGLHFWGHTQDNLWSNISYYKDTAIIRQSMDQIRETIDIAAAHQYQYVNIHPSNYALFEINFQKGAFIQRSEPADQKLCDETFFENLHVLQTHAQRRGIVFTIETIPPYDYANDQDRKMRKNPLDLYCPSNSILVKAATEGFTIANDFGHTVCTMINKPRSVVSQYLFDMTRTLLPQTRLLHLGFVVPPYNGTDHHAHLDTDIFQSETAVPHASEMIELLTLFKDRTDVWALCEPDGRHTENYLFIKNLLEQHGLL
jgi:hypothetical protein